MTDTLPYLDFTDPAIASDPFRAVREVSRDSWIARTPAGYIVLRYDECHDVLKDSRFRTADGLGLPEQGVSSGPVYEWACTTLLAQDGEQHRRIRRLAQPAFTPGSTETLRPFCRELLEDLFSDVAAAGRCEVGAVANRYSVRVICEMLGLPGDDWESVAVWSDAMNQVVSVNVHEQLPRIEKAIGEVNAYMADNIERLRRHPDTSLGSALVAAEEAGGRLNSAELVALFETLLIAGAESTRNQLSFGMYLFAKHPNQWQLLSDNPGLAASATEELLRYRSHIVATARVAREDVIMHGFTIPKGTFVMISLPSPNHDPAVYANASVFDIRRFTNTNEKPQLSFGHGPHICIGAPLARVELQEAFKYLPQRMPNLRIDDTLADPIGWNTPFGVHGPIPLHLSWDVVGQ